MTRRYFEEEMRYLENAAKVFAENHPEQARRLNLDSVDDRDPYVERLFEGFAVLSGRVHERLDNEMPEYTERLLELLAPQFLKPIPALSIVQLQPKPDVVQNTAVLERGTEVRSAPVGPRNLRCRFQTTRDVRLQPLRLDDVALRYDRDNTSAVRLRFTLDRGADLEALDLSRLRLYFHAEAPTASTMHLYFTRRVTRVALSPLQGEPSTVLRGQEWVAPVGMASDQRLLPTPEGVFSGFRLLQEYLCYRRNFWFVDIRGVDRMDATDADGLEVDVGFDRPYPEERRFEREHLRLFCTPVVNLFEKEAEPIRNDAETREHRIVPSAQYPDGIRTYDVQSVTGTSPGTDERAEYSPFLALHNASPNGRSPAREERTYTVHRRPGPDGRHHAYLSLGGAPNLSPSDRPREVLSLSLRCTNGSLPREALTEGMIDRFAAEVPDLATPRNLTRPTQVLPPPRRDDDGYFWSLLSHWSLNYRSVASPEALTRLIRLYDWTDGPANRRRRAGLQRVGWEPKEMIERGGVVRGTEVTLEVNSDHFADEGDLCLFGLVMSRFLSSYSTINSFVHFIITTASSDKQYEWTPRRGTRPLL
jgi:type VI secretion system protein ImpG